MGKRVHVATKYEVELGNTEAFNYLADGSVIKIWPDSGCDHGTVRNGKCEWK